MIETCGLPRFSAVAVDIQIWRAVTLGAEDLGQAAVAKIGSGVAAERDRGGGDAGGGDVQSEAGEPRRALAIDPGGGEPVGSDAKKGCRIPGVEIDHGAPDVARGRAVIDEKRVAAGAGLATDQEVGVGAAVEHVGATHDAEINRIKAAAGVDELVGKRAGDVEIVSAGIDILESKARHWPGVDIAG